MPGTLFFVVGASGVGKDTLIKGAKQALSHDPSFAFARRTITRPADVGDEGHEHVTPDEFARLLASGRFLIHWAAHDLLYGIRAKYGEELMAGKQVVVNGSRAAIRDLLQLLPDAVIVQITARPETISKRLSARGREGESEIQARIERAGFIIPAHAKTVTVANDSDPATAVDKFTSILRQNACRTGV